jgi:hypothetical protein
MHGKVMSETGATFRLSSVYTVKNLEKDPPELIIEEIFAETRQDGVRFAQQTVRLLESNSTAFAYKRLDCLNPYNHIPYIF